MIKVKQEKEKLHQSFQMKFHASFLFFYEVNINKCSLNSYVKMSLQMSGVKMYSIGILKLHYKARNYIVYQPSKQQEQQQQKKQNFVPFLIIYRLQSNLQTSLSTRSRQARWCIFTIKL